MLQWRHTTTAEEREFQSRPWVILLVVVCAAAAGCNVHPGSSRVHTCHMIAYCRQEVIWKMTLVAEYSQHCGGRMTTRRHLSQIVHECTVVWPWTTALHFVIATTADWYRPVSAAVSAIPPDAAGIGPIPMPSTGIDLSLQNIPHVFAVGQQNINSSLHQMLAMMLTCHFYVCYQIFTNTIMQTNLANYRGNVPWKLLFPKSVNFCQGTFFRCIYSIQCRLLDWAHDPRHSGLVKNKALLFRWTWSISACRAVYESWTELSRLGTVCWVVACSRRLAQRSSYTYVAHWSATPQQTEPWDSLDTGTSTVTLPTTVC